MPAEVFANNYSTRLAVGALAGDLSITVTDSPPAALTGGQFRILIESGSNSEYVLVTAVSGTGNKTWTVTRGAEGSTAAAHAAGVYVTHVFTAGVMAGTITVGSPDTGANAAARIAVAHEAPINPQWPEYGVLGNNSDEHVALQAFFTALPAASPEVYFPPGRYRSSTALSLNARTGSLTIKGAGGRNSGAASATQLVLDGGLTCRNTNGIAFQDLQMIYTAAFATNGYLIDARGSVGNPDTQHLSLTRCFISGEGVHQALALLALNRSIVIDVDRCTFSQSRYAVIGREGDDNSVNYSQDVTFKDSDFLALTDGTIIDPGQNWRFFGGTVESLVSGAAGFIVQSATATALGVASSKNLGLYGVGMYDANTSGIWVDWSGQGLTWHGGLVGGGATGCRLAAWGGTTAGTKGVSIHGVTWDTITNFLAAEAGGGANNNDYWDVRSNVLLNGTGGITFDVTGCMPMHGYMEDPTGSLFQFGTMPLYSGAVSDSVFPFGEAPPNGTWAYDQTNHQLYVKSGGTWRKSAAFT